MGEPARVRLSSPSHFGEGRQEGTGRVGDSDSGSPQLAITTMVPGSGTTGSHASPPTSAATGSTDPAEVLGAAQQPRTAPASRLVAVRESLLTSGASDRVIDLVSQSRRKLTENVYGYRV